MAQKISGFFDSLGMLTTEQSQNINYRHINPSIISRDALLQIHFGVSDILGTNFDTNQQQSWVRASPGSTITLSHESWSLFSLHWDPGAIAWRNGYSWSSHPEGNDESTADDSQRGGVATIPMLVAALAARDFPKTENFCSWVTAENNSQENKNQINQQNIAANAANYHRIIPMLNHQHGGLKW